MQNAKLQSQEDERAQAAFDFGDLARGVKARRFEPGGGEKKKRQRAPRERRVKLHHPLILRRRGLRSGHVSLLPASVGDENHFVVVLWDRKSAATFGFYHTGVVRNGCHGLGGIISPQSLY